MRGFVTYLSLLFIFTTLASALKLKTSQEDGTISLFPSRMTNRTRNRPEISDMTPFNITPIREEGEERGVGEDREERVEETLPSERVKETVPSERVEETLPSERVNETIPSETKMKTNELFVPPFFNEDMPSVMMRIIPINFWQGLNRESRVKNFVVLKTKDNQTLSCDNLGIVNFNQFNNTGNNFDHFWIPEEIGENMLRLRSYNGGYLEYDINSNMFICSNRIHNLGNTFHVYLTPIEKRRVCLLLKGYDLRFVSHMTNNLMLRNLTSNLDDFCFYGEEKPKMDEDLWFMSSTNMTNFMGGRPTERVVREPPTTERGDSGMRASSTMRGSSTISAGGETEAATTGIDINLPRGS
jgi:hypothetical protein